ncbi:MAG: TatD family hydrolase [Candidatus Nealsonbacteria bacterium]
MIIDTHAHLNFSAYKNDVGEVVEKTLNNDIWIVNAGSQYSTSRRAVQLAEKYEKGVYAAIGLHPVHLDTGLVKIKGDPEEMSLNTCEEYFDYERYKELAQSEKVVAIGEIGLDYYWRPKTKVKLEPFKQKQKELLQKEIALAKELGLPAIFHCRMAHDDLISMLDSTVNGVVHCFTGNQNQFEKYLELGLYFGLNGLIFKMDSDKIIEQIPLDRILIETDCPYLTPPQEKGRNEPIYIKHVVNKIAQLKNISQEELADITTQNAKKLFNLKT